MATLGGGTTNMTYLGVVNGKFAQRVSEGTEGAEKRTNKDGKVVYEKYHSSAEGIISNMQVRSNEYNGKTFDTLCITLDNEIQMQFPGNIDNIQNKAIINTLLSKECDITKPIRFIATKDEDGYSKVFLMQNDKGIKRFSTKEHPEGVPQPKKTEKLGKIAWDWTEQNEWYYKKFQELSRSIENRMPPSVDDIDTKDIPF